MQDRCFDTNWHHFDTNFEKSVWSCMELWGGRSGRKLEKSGFTGICGAVKRAISFPDDEVIRQIKCCIYAGLRHFLAVKIPGLTPIWHQIFWELLPGILSFCPMTPWRCQRNNEYGLHGCCMDERIIHAAAFFCVQVKYKEICFLRSMVPHGEKYGCHMGAERNWYSFSGRGSKGICRKFNIEK